MKLLLAAILVATSFSCASVSTSGVKQSFSQAIDVSDQWRVLVEESEQEPRSVGSYAVRLYAITSPQFTFDDYRQNLIVKRDGAIERLGVSSQGSDGPTQLSVVIRSAGSGGYLHVDNVGLTKNSLLLLSPCPYLSPDADVKQLIQSEPLMLARCE